jgi:hypothetical protein
MSQKVSNPNNSHFCPCRVETGVIYVMTTAVSGLVKISKVETHLLNKRLAFYELHGYSNLPALKRYFAIEVENCTEKLQLLYKIFENCRVGETELFAVDKEAIKQLLLCFRGRVVYPKTVNQEREFEKSRDLQN